MSFVHLHGHSSYSFLDGYGTPEQIANRLKELGHTVAAITDHGNVYAHVPTQKAYRAAGVKPIFGCEFYIVEDLTERSKYNPSLGADGFPHVTVLAATQRGYENMLKLTGIAAGDGFYYKPRIDWETLAKYQDGLVVLSGCVGGWPSRLLLNRERGVDFCHGWLAERAKEIELFYIELIPEPGLAISEQTLPVLAAMAADLRLPCAMTADAHFPRAEDHEAEDLLLCVGVGKKLSDPSRTLKLPWFQYYCSESELQHRADRCGMPREMWHVHIDQAIANTGIIAEMCNVEIPRAKAIAFPGLYERKAEDVLWEWVVAGAEKRRQQGLLPSEVAEEYRARAGREFTLIRDKGFCDYILAVADLVLWCKSRGGLVMCRGSAGGCLLLWLLGASETDSIRHGLSFERFFDETRTDPPDVDVDFEQSWRGRVIDYVFERYGADNCSQIAALSLQRAKSALHDAANAYGIPDSEIMPLAVLLDSKDDDFDGQITRMKDREALAVLTKYPQLRIVDKIVGQCRQSTVHACGVLISSVPMDKMVAMIAQKGGGHPVSSVDKHGAKELGFLKIDMLSVAAFDVTAEAARRAGVATEQLYRLPLDDPKVYDTANRGLVAGVFQLDGAALGVSKEIGLHTFEELYASSALCRPGPVAYVPLYKKNKYDKAGFEAYLRSHNPIAAEIVRETNGVLLYQEQVMAICNRLGQMPMARVQKLRKRIAESSFHGQELGPEWSDDFYTGAQKNGCSEEEAHYWWDAVKTHGVYSFNKAHCVTYGIVGYWMLWLKTYYPAAYYEKFLELEGGAQQTNELLMKRLIREFRMLGGEVRPIDLWRSRRSFVALHDRCIVGGWSNITGIGPVLAGKMEASGPYRGWDDVAKVMGKAMFAKLSRAWCLDGGPPDMQLLAHMMPWLPVPMTMPAHEKTRRGYGLEQPGLLPGEEQRGDTSIAGYVTAAHKRNRTGSFKGDQILYAIEDESGWAIARVANKHLGTIGVRCKQMKVGDYVAVSGWWSGDTLFIKDFQVVDAWKGGKK